MHVIFRESHGIEEAAIPKDLGQSPADLVALSFSDSDLGAFAEGWRRSQDGLPTLRLANLADLQHPLSVDTYLEQTLSGAKGILIRLIGGVPYWTYGLQQVEALAREKRIALAVLPADGRPDERLDDISTLPVSTLRRLSHLCDAGGAVAAQAALAQLSLAAGLYAGPVTGARALPDVGGWTPEDGVTCPAAFLANAERPLAVVCFYRAYLAAADTAPVAALIEALRARGFAALGLFAPSLKAPDPRGWIKRWISALNPAAVVNVTAFSATGEDGGALDAAGAPVFQAALSTTSQSAWLESERGLSAADLAMHVVLPEVDGRVFLGVASFKEAAPRDEDLEFGRVSHRPAADRIALIADRVAARARLAELPADKKRVAMVLSTYPGKAHQMAHAVGLDALASTDAVLLDLAREGYDVAPVDGLATRLANAGLTWSLAEYLEALKTLPAALRDDLFDAWGPPEHDPEVQGGALRFRAFWSGSALIALQPERSASTERDAEYHDLGRTPRHAYVAFYLWLRSAAQVDALVHVGAHGTLEWLPGKSVALSAACWPEALIGALPVIYPFIVNDPGEAAQAKRRLGAITLGHAPPPLRTSGAPERMARLETLLDEFSNADGLDPRRRDRLQDDIRDEARALGVEDDLGIESAADPAEAITRIDRFVCDIKESQFGDGLHVYGRADWGATEREGLLAALSGRHVAPGPSGSPFRGRTDVFPTGRNLFTTDPRATPSRNAFAQGVRLADELIRRHLQDHGEYPRGLVVDLWGSATMRTAGEEFAMALHLIGARPIWDEGSERVSGVEIAPLAMLDRPRIDVTLRVSGLFRDVYPNLATLFGQAVQALAAREEAPDFNPFVSIGAGARVYGPAPGEYGLGLGALVEDYSDGARRAAGDAWLAASAWPLDATTKASDHDGIAARVAQADAFVHLQDLPETDLLLAADYAAHEAGFAAAKQNLGGDPASLYHLDATRPDAPRARRLGEEVARVVRGRAANPDWIAGMMRHGFRGGAEIAATLDHMAAFAHLAGVVEPHLFDLFHEATLGDDAVREFLTEVNPEALQAMERQFAALLEAGLWRTRSNSIQARLAAAS